MAPVIVKRRPHSVQETALPASGLSRRVYGVALEMVGLIALLLACPAVAIAQPGTLPVEPAISESSLSGQEPGITPPAFDGTPGAANCARKSIAGSTRRFDGLQAAADALGFPSVGALRGAIRDFCTASIVDLGTLPGGTFSSAVAINDHGQVVGIGDTGSGFRHAILWTRGAIIDLGTLPGGSQSTATAINEHGQVTGYGDTPSGQQHAFLWERGVMTDLGPLEPGGSGAARALNDHGQVVGEGETAATGATHAAIWQNGIVIDVAPGVAFTNNERGQVVGYTVFGGAFLWDNGATISLGTLPGGGFSLATDLNEHAQVVGWSEIASGQSHAFLWMNNRIRDLGTLPNGAASIANAINDRGQVVGQSGTASGDAHAFFWERGVMADIGTLPGDTSSEAIAINRRGQVVGFSNSSSGSGLFLWDRGTIVDLGIGGNFPDARLQVLNNRGEVVGQYLTASGEVHAALWTNLRRHDHDR